MVEPAGVEPASCDDFMTIYYMLVLSLLFRVLALSRQTDGVQTAPSGISHADRWVRSLCQNTACAPFLSVRRKGDVAVKRRVRTLRSQLLC